MGHLALEDHSTKLKISMQIIKVMRYGSETLKSQYHLQKKKKKKEKAKKRKKVQLFPSLRGYTYVSHLLATFLMIKNLISMSESKVIR